MAQWQVETEALDPRISSHYEVMMLATNNAQQVSNTNPMPVVTNNEFIYAAPWDLQVARGKVSGVSQINIFGYGGAVDGTWIPLWEANTTLSFTNAPTSGTEVTFKLYANTYNGSNTITWPASVKWQYGQAPTQTTTANKTDIYSFTTNDAGVTYFGYVSGLNF